MPIEHLVVVGESTSSLAADYGFFPHTIWDHPDNLALKNKRKHMNILMPGDVISIPDKKLKEVAAATEQMHSFVMKGTPALFKLQLYYSDGKPRKSQDYQLFVDDKSYTGTTDGQGTLTKYISPKASSGKIILVPQMETIKLQFGKLNPITEDSGVRQRLANLGFVCGEDAEELQAALALFQKDCNLEETGELNDETRQKLEDLHDTVSEYPIEEGANGNDG